MFKKFFCKALVVLAIMITLTTLLSVSALAVEENTVMTVYTKDLDEEIYKEFDNFEDGWVFLMENYATYFDDFDVKLYADWVAPDGKFYYTNAEGNEVGTDNGRLAVGFLLFNEGGKYNHNQINIDLNGHKIDRNLKAPTENGQVFYIKNGTIRIFDFSEAQTGMITGANNDGDGGAFYVYDGSLYIEGGEITGNYAENGAGIYWYSDNNLCITGGKITGNIAVENGGGIYHDGGGAFGGGTDNVYFGGYMLITENTGANGAPNNLYLANDSVFLNHAYGQDDDIPYRTLSDDTVIGISSSVMGGLISGDDSCFDVDDYKCFVMDNKEYYIRVEYDAAGENNAYKLYIDSIKNMPDHETEFKIINYNEQTKEATVFVPEEGKYSLVFADYENDRLENMDIVEYEFKEGINGVLQEVTSFTLASGDKVMLWYDMINLIPVCEALTVK